MAREEEQHRVQEQTAELAVMNEKLNQEIAKCKRIGEALKESESRLSGILSSMIDLVFAFDSEGRFTFHHTPRVRDLYVPPEEFIGKRHSEVMPPYLNKPFAEAFEKNKKGEVAEYEYWLEICSRIRWFSAKLSPVFLEGEFTGSVAVIRESTERKRAEEVLREAREDLERRVDERTLELALANEQLRQEIEERRRAEDELEQHAERLKILHEIDQGILAARSPKEVAQAALHYVRRLVPCLGAAVIVLDFEVGEAMVLCAEVNGQLVGHTGTRLPLEEFEVAEDLMRSLRQGEVHVVEDILAIPQLPPVLQILQTEGLHSVLNVPLIAEEEIIGVLSLAAPSPGPSVAEHVDIACEVAGPLAIAIQQARLFDKVRTARERLRRLARQIVLTQEEERQRLSRALHDEAGQALTALKINLELIEEDLPVEFSSLRQRIGDAAGLTDATMEQIRSLAQDLRPPTLDAVGLNPTLEGFCSDFAKRTGLSIDYLGLELPILPEEVNTCLYRFLQEALTNVAKHACANQVHVALCYDAETVHLSVKDDGRGFDKQARLSFSGWPMGIGLLGMQERLESLGGRLEIESRPGQGTRLVAYIPTGDIP
jgi:PAS domain S-box-containing protein